MADKIDREEVREKAKDIIDSFAEELDKIEDLEEARVERVKDRREEGNGKEANPDFRKRILDNAPKSKNGYIRSEKGEWTK